MSEIPEIFKGLLLDQGEQGTVSDLWKFISGVDGGGNGNDRLIL